MNARKGTHTHANEAHDTCLPPKKIQAARITLFQQLQPQYSIKLRAQATWLWQSLPKTMQCILLS